MRIYLLRHGETDWNVHRRLQGTVDTPLNDTGVEQAESWRPYFDRLRLDGIYSSGLQRALHTALLATGRPACIIDRFNERNFGAWQGETWADLELSIPDLDTRWSDNAFSPPGGESRAELFARVRSAIDAITSDHESDDDVLIVAHGASGHAILANLLGGGMESRGSLPTLTNASLSIVDLEAPTPELVAAAVTLVREAELSFGRAG